MDEESRPGTQPPEIDDEAVAAHWDRNAPSWAAQVRRGHDFFRMRINNPAMFGLIGSVAGLRVLDLGCGEGYNTRLLAESAATVTGVDISVEMVRLAREEEARRPLGITYHTASFSDMTMLTADSFDIAVSFMALMDGADYAGAVAEAARVVRPGGRLVFSILHPCFVTPSMRWSTDPGTGRTDLVVGRYFEDVRFVEEWSFSRSPESDQHAPFQVPRFQRTLSDYLNPLGDQGFCIEQILEPRPAEADVADDPELEKWRRDAALFLHVKARKL